MLITLLNLFNELGKSDKMRGLPSFLIIIWHEFNKFNKIMSMNVRFYLSQDIKITFLVYKHQDFVSFYTML